MDISTTPSLAAPERADTTHLGCVDDRSFDAFYGQTAPSIAKALAVTLNDAELAADATNEAMTRAFQRWTRISRYDNPAAWVYRVGLNWSLSWRQRRRRERERPVRLTATRHEPVYRDDSLDGALASLSIDRRAVVVCRIYLDWSVEQTAEALGVAEGTVKSRLARALGDLKAHLDQDKDKGVS